MDACRGAPRRRGKPPVVAGLLLAVTAVFIPPRLITGAPPGLPGPNVVGGGEVLIEATVDTSGALVHPIVLRTTAPYTNMLLDAITRWRFAPAHGPDRQGRDHLVESQVLIGAAYRPPTLANGPTLGTPSSDVGHASTGSPYPVTTAMPTQPPQASSAGVVMLELSLDESGATKGIRMVAGNPAFAAPAQNALAAWRFRGAAIDGHPVPSMAYVIMGFPLPVVVTPPGQ
jgi:hypothetical protein